MLLSRRSAGVPNAEAKQAARFRVPTEGPEYDLCLSWIRQLQRPSSGEMTVLIEPRIGGAFPDVVVVYWDPRVAETWPLERAKLTDDDLRVAHLLWLSGSVLQSQLRALNGRPVDRSLDRLWAAGILSECPGQELRLRPLEDIYAVTRIVAVEAKVKPSADGLMQAARNSWFASESYLLCPRFSEAWKARAELAGVGLITADSRLSGPVRDPSHYRLPVSFGSWLLNDWVWNPQSSEGVTHGL